LKISIITINLNNASGLQLTIDSVLGQTNTDFEWILIDGASSDDSIEIIKRYSDRFSYWISEKDNGIYHAFNKGINKAGNEYCLFLNSGDQLFNDRVLEDISMANLSADIVTGSALVEGAKKLRILVNAPDKISFYSFYYHTILHQASLIRRRLFKDIGPYNENLKIIADWEFFIKAFFLHRCTYQAINVTISIFDNQGISSAHENSSIIVQSRREVLNKYFPYFIEDYNLMSPIPIYIFLKNIKKLRLLRSSFVLTCRAINKITKFLQA